MFSNILTNFRKLFSVKIKGFVENFTRKIKLTKEVISDFVNSFISRWKFNYFSVLFSINNNMSSKKNRYKFKTWKLE